MEIKIYTGEYEIIGSGTIITNLNEPIELSISTLVYKFEFVNNLDDPKTGLKTEQFNNEKGLLITLVNFNNSLGQGNIKPISIGTINNRKLFLNFRVYTMTEESGKTFHYSLLLEKEVKDGK